MYRVSGLVTAATSFSSECLVFIAGSNHVSLSVPRAMTLAKRGSSHMFMREVLLIMLVCNRATEYYPFLLYKLPAQGSKKD
jgi:hypothetical protein